MSDRAVRIHRFGGAEVLSIDSVAPPQPTGDEIVVRTLFSSVNPVDWKTREGAFPPVGDDALPFALGRDVCGRVAAMGTQVRNLSEGDLVMAMPAMERGANADHVLLKATEFVAVPDGVDAAQAGALPLVGLTAWQGLFDHGGLERGQRVLIHGGAGGVGHVAIQLAKACGAWVATTCRGSDKPFVTDLGADRAIDYQSERFDERLSNIDLVFDLVGGETQARSWDVIAAGGRMVSTIEEPDAVKAEARGAQAVPRYMAQPNAHQLGEMAAMMADGRLRVVVSERFPLDRIADAQRALEREHVRGKIALVLSDG